MPLKLADTAVSKLYLGSTQVPKVYLGSATVFQAGGGENLLLNARWSGGPPPTNWPWNSQTGQYGRVDLGGCWAYQFYGTAQRQHLTQSISLTSGVQYCLSFYCENKVSGDSQFVFDIFNISVTWDVTYGKLSASQLTQGSRHHALFTPSSSGTGTLRLGLGVTTDSSSDFTLSRPQLERAGSPSTWLST